MLGRRLLSEGVDLRFRVEGEPLIDRGDGDPVRLSRLGWLDSRITLEDALVNPYLSLRLEDDEITLLVRRRKIGRSGLPASIQSYFTPEATGVGREA